MAKNRVTKVERLRLAPLARANPVGSPKLDDNRARSYDFPFAAPILSVGMAETV